MALLDGLIKKLNGEEDPLAASNGGFGAGAPGGMPGTPGNPNTGISGGLGNIAQAVAGLQPGAVQASPAKSTLGAFANRLEGFDSGKLNDASYNSPKYAIGRALSGFDPRQGVTDDVLKALNSSGAGQQYTRLSGDKVRGQDGRVVDLVRGFNDPNGTGGWQLGLEDEAGAQPVGGQRPSFTGSAIPGLLQGDAMGGIQSALGKLGQTQDDSLLQRLIAQLGGH